LAVLITLAVVGAGCGGSGSGGKSDTTTPAGSGSGGGAADTTPVRVRLSNDIDSLDPIRTAVGDGIAASLYAYDTMLANIDGKAKPQLAERWKATASSIELWVRDDVTCADGTKLTAKDYAANVRRYIDPAAPSKDVNAVFGSGKVTVAADDAQRSVTIKVSKPFGGLTEGMARIPIVCPAGLAAPSELKTKTFGTGPYVLKEAHPGDRYVYTKRAGYKWGPDGATNDKAPSQVVFRVVTSDTTAANLLLAHDLDISTITGPDRERVTNAPGMKEQLVTPSLWHLMFNENKTHPGYSEDVRKALALSVNREELAQAAGGQFARLASSFLIPEAQCYSADDKTAIPATDVDAAKQALARAGYGPGGKKLTIKLVIFNAMPAAADYLIDAYKKIGIDVKSRVVDGNELGRVLLETFDWDVTVANTFPTDPIRASGYVSGPFPPKGDNHTWIVNPTYDQLSKEAKRDVTSTQCARWIPADRALFERVDLLPLYWEDVATYSDRYNFTPIKYLTAGVYPTSIVKK
jgi:peptide/nickel transport system substrate-binding protein